MINLYPWAYHFLASMGLLSMMLQIRRVWARQGLRDSISGKILSLMLGLTAGYFTARVATYFEFAVLKAVSNDVARHLFSSAFFGFIAFQTSYFVVHASLRRKARLDDAPVLSRRGDAREVP